MVPMRRSTIRKPASLNVDECMLRSIVDVIRRIIFTQVIIELKFL